MDFSNTQGFEWFYNDTGWVLGAPTFFLGTAMSGGAAEVTQQLKCLSHNMKTSVQDPRIHGKCQIGEPQKAETKNLPQQADQQD